MKDILNRLKELNSTDDFIIPNDYGSKTNYLINQLNQADSSIRAAAVDILVDLFLNSRTNNTVRKADIIELLAEVGHESPKSVCRISSLLVDTLISSPDVTEHRQVLKLLSRCGIPNYDWLPLILPYLNDPETAMLAYLALYNQHPSQSSTYLPGVLETIKKSNLPTDLFSFVLQHLRNDNSKSEPVNTLPPDKGRFSMPLTVLYAAGACTLIGTSHLLFGHVATGVGFILLSVVGALGAISY